MKKVLSTILVLAILVAMPVAALAADGEVVIDASFNLPTVTVTLPGSGSLVLNPFELDIDSAAAPQLVFQALEIENQSDVAVKINLVDCALTLSKGTTAATAAVKDTATEKQIFAYLSVLENTTGDAEDVVVDAYDKTNSHQLILSTVKTTKKNVIELENKDAASNENLAVVVMGGNMTSSPAIPWNATDDTVKLSMKFTFDLVGLEPPVTP